jgi:hypothetical protein
VGWSLPPVCVGLGEGVRSMSVMTKTQAEKALADYVEARDRPGFPRNSAERTIARRYYEAIKIIRAGKR